MTTISQMSFSDLDQVTKLCEQLGYPDRLQDIQTRYVDLVNRPHYALFVAKNQDQVIGWIQVNLEAASLVVGAKAEIAALVVDQNCRSQGVGSQLVQRAEEWAKAQGLTLMRVRSNVKREAAHRFYQREGYVLSKTGHFFVKHF